MCFPKAASEPSMRFLDYPHRIGVLDLEINLVHLPRSSLWQTCSLLHLRPNGDRSLN